ncbi:MAG: lamin tail domain-containing protein, partial [Myxococcales bacterium]|nr:lamin tail domain-containing protein [Myxococcales bacterium]
RTLYAGDAVVLTGQAFDDATPAGAVSIPSASGQVPGGLVELRAPTGLVDRMLARWNVTSAREVELDPSALPVGLWNTSSPGTLGDGSPFVEPLYIEGDIGDACTTSNGRPGTVDCVGVCAPTSWLGDGHCGYADDYDLTCPELDNDAGDCVTNFTMALLEGLHVEEVLLNPGGLDTNCDELANDRDEMVELVNIGPVALELGGIALHDDTYYARHVFAAGTVLAPNESIVVYGGGTPSCPGVRGVAASSGTLGLSNYSERFHVSAVGHDRRPLTPTIYGTSGTSATRAVALDPTAGFVDHSSVSPLSASPGHRVDGSAY